MYKKLLIVFLLFSFNIFAKDLCYSVELLSIPKSSKSFSITRLDGCKKFQIGNYFAVRCGCTKNIKDIQSILHKYKSQFPKAYITKTYKYRFQIKKREEEKDPSQTVTKFNKTININQTNKVKEFLIYGYDFLNLKKERDFIDKKNIETTIEKLYKNRDLQLKFLSDSSKFYGLSIDAKYDQYFNQNYRGREYTDFEYNVKLKYDFFKNGYFGHQKELKNKKNLVKTVFYNNIINLEKYSYKQTIQNIDSLSSLINFNYYSSYYNLTQEMLLKQSNLGELGVVPTYEIELLKQDMMRYKKLIAMYDKITKIPLNYRTYNLLKNIQNIKLLDKDTMKEYAKKYNSDVLLQTSKLELLENTKDYFDDSVVNMYASNRTMDELGRYNTIGVEAILPLNVSSFENEKLKKLQKSSIIAYKNALYVYLNNSIENLYNEFEQRKALLINNQLEFDILNDKLHKYKLIEEHNVASLNMNIVKKTYLLKERMLELKLDISNNKLLLLKTMVKIAYITNKLDINSIIQKR